MAQFLIVEALIEGVRLEDELAQRDRDLAVANAHAIADTHAQLNAVLDGAA